MDPEYRFFSVGALLELDAWLQGDEIVPLELSTILAKLALPSEPKEKEMSMEEIMSFQGVEETPCPSAREEELEAERDRVWDQSREEEEDPSPESKEMSPEEIMSLQGVESEGLAADTIRAWMRYHEFEVVSSIEQLDEIITAAIKVGKCALDLETEGFDNRIYMLDPNDIKGVFEEYWEGSPPPLIPQTKHKIVGYCLCYDGHTGYYAPVRHTGESLRENLDLVEAGKLIKKLCLAAQPELSPESLKVDPLAGKFKTPPRVKLYFHHAKFDQEFLYPVTGIDYWHPDSFEDSLLLYYCIYTGDKALGLKPKSKEKLVVLDKQGVPIRGYILKDPKKPLHEIVQEDPKGSTIPYEMIEMKELFLRGRKVDFARLSPEEARRYACSDAICTFLHCTSPELQKAAQNPKYANTYRLEKQVAQVLRWMERHRIKINLEYVNQLFTEARAEADEYRQQILALANQMGWKEFDPSSTQQLSEFLFNHPAGLNIEPKPEKNEKSGQYKTDADTLEELVKGSADVNPILLTIVKYRQVEKVISTYLTGMKNNCDANAELRYQFKQVGAPTGRFTAPSGEPEHGFGGIPIHGIPATYDETKPRVSTALRQAFIAREGYTMVKVDFAGEELRIVTNLSKEPVWIKEFNEGTGDLHTITAKAFFGPEITKQQRQMGKCVHPDTLVVSMGEYMPISKLGTYPEAPEAFADFSGSLFDGKQDSPVTALFNGGMKDLYHVIVSGGILTCSGDHRLKTREGNWVKVSDLCMGTLLEECSAPALGEGVYPILSLNMGKRLPSLQINSDNDLAYLAGGYAGVSGQSNLRVPSWILLAGRTAALHYLGGLFDARGTVTEGHCLDWTCQDFIFAGQIVTLLKACGLSTEVTLQKQHVRLRVMSGYSWELREYLQQPEKRSLLQVPQKRAKKIDMFRVIQILPAGKGPCLDVTMGTREHQYQANGFISHNSANFSLVYGGGTMAIMRATKCSQQEAARRKSNFDKALPRFAAWVKAQRAIVKKDCGVTTAFGRWMAIPDANSPDRAISAACERYALNWPVQGGGADIMKISMVLLYKEFWRRGWVQEATARFLLTVHDELVFEIKHEALMEVMPVIEHLMTLPGQLALPAWVVKLEVEPLLDLHWDPKYDYHKIMHGYIPEAGKKPGKEDIQVGPKYYQPIPPWLKGYLTPDYMKAGTVPTPQLPLTLGETPKQVSTSPSLVAGKPKEMASQGRPSQFPKPKEKKVDVFTYGLNTLTRDTVRQVAALCLESHDPEGVLLQLYDQANNEILIDPSLGILVNPETFKVLMRSKNL
jgi:DNA polymerase I-like protein with 3'-5' exonuclease and polymerase domains